MDERRPLWGLVGVRRDEVKLTALMCACFFAVITTFWILKPLKKAMFVGFYKQAGPFTLGGLALEGSQAELLAKVANMLVALVAAAVFATVARRLRRERLVIVFAVFCAVSIASFALAGGTPTEGKAWLFYLYGDLYNSLMVAAFFAFLNDSVTPDAARRTYGPIVLGGVAGGAFGSLFVQARVEAFSFVTWMVIALGVTVMVGALAAAAGAAVRARPPPEPEPTPASSAPARSQGGLRAAFDGARLVARSRYLLAIACILGVYEVVSSVLDFQFTATIEAHVAADGYARAFSTVYGVTNATALLVQLFVTGFVLRRYRHGVALLVMPVAVLSASAGYLALPVVLMGSVLSVSDNALNYSLNQSAREALYTPVTRDEKYKAKAFIDMFVQRAAKTVAVGVSLVITTAFTSFESVRYLSIFTMLLVLVWIAAARYAGRRFEELTKGGGAA